MTQLYIYEPTGEFREPQVGEYYISGTVIQRAHGIHETKRYLYRAIPAPIPAEPRIIEQGGKRYRFVERRVPKSGELFLAEAGPIKGELAWGMCQTEPRDIYELIEQEGPMRIEIYDDSKELEPEPIRLQLINNNPDRIMVVAVDRDGVMINGGAIVTFRTNGTMYREVACGVPGIQTESGGRIKIVE